MNLVLSSAFSRRFKFVYSLGHIVDQKEHSHETHINNVDYSTTQKVRAFSNILAVICLSLPQPSVLYSLFIHSQSSPKTLFDKLITKQYKWSYATRGDKAPHKSHRVTQTLESGLGNFPSGCWLLGPKETPHTKQVFFTVLACFSELEGKNLLVKTPYASDTGFGKIELEMA